jgi:hypothetical protein
LVEYKEIGFEPYKVGMNKLGDRSMGEEGFELF